MYREEELKQSATFGTIYSFSLELSVFMSLISDTFMYMRSIPTSYEEPKGLDINKFQWVAEDHG